MLFTTTLSSLLRTLLEHFSPDLAITLSSQPIMVQAYSPDSLYPYRPSKAAPIAFAILLTALGIFQFYQSNVRYPWKKFGWTMIWTTTVWIAGFVCRTISVYNVHNVNLYIAQTVLVLMGPPLYAAAEYFILRRLLAYLPYHAPIDPERVFSTFFLLSGVVESLTANGAANSADSSSSPSERKRGLDELKAALIVGQIPYLYAEASLLTRSSYNASSKPSSSPLSPPSNTAAAAPSTFPTVYVQPSIFCTLPAS